MILTVLFILTVSLLPFGAFRAYSLLLLFLMATTLLAQLSPTYILKRSLVAIPFALAAITLPFTVPGRTLLTLPFWGGISISVEGTIRLVSILIKSWPLADDAHFGHGDNFPGHSRALRALRVPPPLIAIGQFDVSLSPCPV